MKRILFLFVVFPVLLSSCAPVVSTVSDEIRLNSWSARLKNGSSVALSFTGDNADFIISHSDKSRCSELKGLCVIDGDELMIYNSSDGEPYIFEYTLNDNKLVLKYDGGKLSLTKDN